MPKFKNSVPDMVRKSTEETGCHWCRHFKNNIGKHLVTCAKSKLPMVHRSNYQCPGFKRGLNVKKHYPVRLFDGCTFHVLGLYLNQTDIDPGDLIGSDNLYKLLQMAVLVGDVHLKVKRKP